MVVASRGVFVRCGRPGGGALAHLSLVALIATANAHAAPHHLGDLTWMKAYVGQRVWVLHEDPRLKRDVYRVFAAPTVPWMSGSDGKSLAAGIYSGATGGYLSYGGDRVRNTPAGGIEADGSFRGVVESTKWLFWSNAAATDGIIVFVELERGENSHGDRYVDSSVYSSQACDSPLPADFTEGLMAWRDKLTASGARVTQTITYTGSAEPCVRNPQDAGQ